MAMKHLYISYLDQVQCNCYCTMQLHYFLHKFFYIFNFLTSTFYFFLIFFYLMVEIESYFL